MSWVERDGVRLYMERAGTGPPLLYISGTGADLRLRPNVFDQELARHFDLVAYDQRGLGQSDQPEGPYTMAAYADDAAAILDAVGFSRAAVIGISFGGMVAQELALRHRERISRLVLACTSSGGAGGSSYPLEDLVRLPGPERIDKTLAITDSRWADPACADPLRDEARKRLVDAAPPTPGALLQLEARSHHDTFARLGSIDCPVLVCGGRYDALAPPANLESLAGAIAGAKLRFYEGGHRFLAQDPRALRDVVAFLED